MNKNVEEYGRTIIQMGRMFVEHSRDFYKKSDIMFYTGLEYGAGNAMAMHAYHLPVEKINEASMKAMHTATTSDSDAMLNYYRGVARGMDFISDYLGG